jgi:hypothetical protein
VLSLPSGTDETGLGNNQTMLMNSKGKNIGEKTGINIYSII